MSAQTAADLRAAANILRRDGWTQGAYHRVKTGGSVCHCTLGAIAAAVTGEKFANPDHEDFLNRDQAKRYWDAVSKLNRSLDLDGDLETVHEWNDYQAENADQVIAALEAAATTAEQATHGSDGQR